MKDIPAWAVIAGISIALLAFFVGRLVQWIQDARSAMGKPHDRCRK